MDEASIKQNIKNSGINLQLYVADYLINNGWKCQLDKLFTDDETNITRELDISAKKSFTIQLDIKSNNPYIKNIINNVANNLSFNKIIVDIYLSIECKYLYSKKLAKSDNWIFFASKNNSLNDGLKWVIKRFSYPIFNTPFISMTSFFNLKEKESFRKTQNIIIAETGQNHLDSNKSDVRDGLLKTIKYIIFLLRGTNRFGGSIWLIKNNIIDKIINRIPVKCIKIFHSKNSLSFAPLKLELFYPVVISEGGDLIFYDNKNDRLTKNDHIIVNQNYLSRSFLNKKEVDSLGHDSENEAMNFYVDFINKGHLPKYLEDIEGEVKLIAEAVKNTFLAHTDELILYMAKERIYGEERAIELMRNDIERKRKLTK